jgi:hypothetical protein
MTSSIYDKAMRPVILVDVHSPFAVEDFRLRDGAYARRTSEWGTPELGRPVRGLVGDDTHGTHTTSACGTLRARAPCPVGHKTRPFHTRAVESPESRSTASRTPSSVRCSAKPEESTWKSVATRKGTPLGSIAKAARHLRDDASGTPCASISAPEHAFPLCTSHAPPMNASLAPGINARSASAFAKSGAYGTNAIESSLHTTRGRPLHRIESCADGGRYTRPESDNSGPITMLELVAPVKNVPFTPPTLLERPTKLVTERQRRL